MKCINNLEKSSINNTRLDKFYTNDETSNKYIQLVEEHYNWSIWDLVIEPSAGNGSFYTKIPVINKVGIDIEPEYAEIIKQDFFTYNPDPKYNKILVIGNPPFGRVSSLAIKFFNHAAKWANVIAFIVPRTFRRISIHNKLNSSFHLIYDDDIPLKPCAFIPVMFAKCCFQIWEKKEDKRMLIEVKTEHKDWEFVGLGKKDKNKQPTPPKNADFALRAYGGKCGEIIIENLEILRPKSWHWIKSNIDKNLLVERLSKLNYSVSLNTARQNSIGRSDLIKLYEETYN